MKIKVGENIVLAGVELKFSTTFSKIVQKRILKATERLVKDTVTAQVKAEQYLAESIEYQKLLETCQEDIKNLKLEVFAMYPIVVTSKTYTQLKETKEYLDNIKPKVKDIHDFLATNTIPGFWERAKCMGVYGDDIKVLRMLLGELVEIPKPKHVVKWTFKVG